MSRKERRRLKTRLDKLTRGVRQMGLYALPAVLAALVGCVPPPNVIHVSKDGRFVIVPYNNSGVNVALDQQATLVMIDLETNTVSTLGNEVKAPCWIDRADQTIAFMHIGTDKKPLVSVIRSLDRTDFHAAAYPALSPDGNHLVCAKMDSDLTKPEQLIVHDLIAGTQRELSAAGIPAGYSPDGKQILYITRERTGDAWSLHVIDPQGRNDRTLAQLDATTESTFIPRWLDDRRVLYRTRTEQSPTDGELFIVDLDGKATQVTNNDIEEAHAQLLDENRMVFMDIPAKGRIEDLSALMGEIKIAKKEGEQWNSTAAIQKAFYFAAGGERIVAVREKNDKANLVTFTVDEPENIIDLDVLIREKLPGFSEK